MRVYANITALEFQQKTILNFDAHDIFLKANSITVFQDKNPHNKSLGRIYYVRLEESFSNSAEDARQDVVKL